MSRRIESEKFSFKTRLLATLILLSFNAQLFGTELSQLRNEDRQLVERYIDIANRQRNSNAWLDIRDKLLSTLTSKWQDEKLHLGASYQDTRASVLEFSIEEYLKWSLASFFKLSFDRSNFRASIKGMQDKYLYIKSPQQGDTAKFAYKDIRNLARDKQNWDKDLSTNIRQMVDDFLVRGAKLKLQFAAELGVDLSNKTYSGLFDSTLKKYQQQYKNSLSSIGELESQRFMQLRTYDQASKRNESEAESAASILELLSEDLNKKLSNDLAKLQTTVKSWSGGTADALSLEEWQKSFNTAYENGTRAWEQAEEKLFLQRLEWEQLADKHYLEAENSWEQAQQKLEQRQTEWEEELEQLILDGQKLWQSQETELQEHLANMRLEFLSQLKRRKQSFANSLTSLLEIYRQSGSKIEQAKSNKSYWANKYYNKELRRDPTDKESILGGELIDKVFDPKYISAIQTKDEHAYANKQLSFWQATIDSGTKELETISKKLLESYSYLLQDKKGLYKGTGSSDLGDNIKSLALTEQLGAIAGDLAGNRYLDAYQLNLIKSTILKDYWKKELELNTAVLDYAREKLSTREQAGTSKARLDKALLHYKNVQKAYEEALAKLTSLNEDLGAARTDIDLKFAKIQEQEAELQDLHRQMEEQQSILAISDLSGQKELIRRAYERFDLKAAAHSQSFASLIKAQERRELNKIRVNSLQRIKNIWFGSPEYNIPSLDQLEKLKNKASVQALEDLLANEDFLNSPAAKQATSDFISAQELELYRGNYEAWLGQYIGAYKAGAPNRLSILNSIMSKDLEQITMRRELDYEAQLSQLELLNKAGLKAWAQGSKLLARTGIKFPESGLKFLDQIRGAQETSELNYINSRLRTEKLELRKVAKLLEVKMTDGFGQLEEYPPHIQALYLAKFASHSGDLAAIKTEVMDWLRNLDIVKNSLRGKTADSAIAEVAADLQQQSLADPRVGNYSIIQKFFRGESYFNIAYAKFDFVDSINRESLEEKRAIERLSDIFASAEGSALALVNIAEEQHIRELQASLQKFGLVTKGWDWLPHESLRALLQGKTNAERQGWLAALTAELNSKSAGLSARTRDLSANYLGQITRYLAFLENEYSGAVVTELENKAIDLEHRAATKTGELNGLVNQTLELWGLRSYSAADLARPTTMQQALFNINRQDKSLFQARKFSQTKDLLPNLYQFWTLSRELAAFKGSELADLAWEDLFIEALARKLNSSGTANLEELWSDFASQQAKWENKVWAQAWETETSFFTAKKDEIIRQALSLRTEQEEAEKRLFLRNIFSSSQELGQLSLTELESSHIQEAWISTSKLDAAQEWRAGTASLSIEMWALQEELAQVARAENIKLQALGADEFLAQSIHLKKRLQERGLATGNLEAIVRQQNAVQRRAIEQQLELLKQSSLYNLSHRAKPLQELGMSLKAKLSAYGEWLGASELNELFGTKLASLKEILSYQEAQLLRFERNQDSGARIRSPDIKLYAALEQTKHGTARLDFAKLLEEFDQEKANLWRLAILSAKARTEPAAGLSLPLKLLVANLGKSLQARSISTSLQKRFFAEFELYLDTPVDTEFQGTRRLLDILKAAPNMLEFYLDREFLKKLPTANPAQMAQQLSRRTASAKPAAYEHLAEALKIRKLRAGYSNYEESLLSYLIREEGRANILELYAQFNAPLSSSKMNRDAELDFDNSLAALQHIIVGNIDGLLQESLEARNTSDTALSLAYLRWRQKSSSSESFRDYSKEYKSIYGEGEEARTKFMARGDISGFEFDIISSLMEAGRNLETKLKAYNTEAILTADGTLIDTAMDDINKTLSDDQRQLELAEEELRAKYQAHLHTGHAWRQEQEQLREYYREYALLASSGREEQAKTRIARISDKLRIARAGRELLYEDWEQARLNYEASNQRYGASYKILTQQEQVYQEAEQNLRIREAIFQYASSAYLPERKEDFLVSSYGQAGSPLENWEQTALHYSIAQAQYDALAELDQTKIKSSIQDKKYLSIYNYYRQLYDQELKLKKSKALLGTALTEQSLLVGNALTRVDDNMRTKLFREASPVLSLASSYRYQGSLLGLSKNNLAQNITKWSSRGERILYALGQRGAKEATDKELSAKMDLELINRLWNEDSEKIWWMEQFVERNFSSLLSLDLGLLRRNNNESTEERAREKQAYFNLLKWNKEQRREWIRKLIAKGFSSLESSLNKNPGLRTELQSYREQKRREYGVHIDKLRALYKNEAAWLMDTYNTYASIHGRAKLATDLGLDKKLIAQLRARSLALDGLGISSARLEKNYQTLWDNYFYNGGSIYQLQEKYALSSEVSLAMLAAYQQRNPAPELSAVHWELKDSHALARLVQGVELAAGIREKYPELDPKELVRTYALDKKLWANKIAARGISTEDLSKFAFARWHESRNSSKGSRLSNRDPAFTEILKESRVRVEQELRHLDLKNLFMDSSATAISDEKIMNIAEEAQRAYKELSADKELYKLYEFYRDNSVLGTTTLEGNTALKSFMDVEVPAKFLAKAKVFIEGKRSPHVLAAAVSAAIAQALIITGTALMGIPIWGPIIGSVVLASAAIPIANSIVELVKAGELKDIIKMLDNDSGAYSANDGQQSKETLLGGITEHKTRQDFYKKELKKLQILQGKGGEEGSIAKSLVLALEIQGLEAQSFYGPEKLENEDDISYINRILIGIEDYPGLDKEAADSLGALSNIVVQAEKEKNAAHRNLDLRAQLIQKKQSSREASISSAYAELQETLTKLESSGDLDKLYKLQLQASENSGTRAEAYNWKTMALYVEELQKLSLAQWRELGAEQKQNFLAILSKEEIEPLSGASQAKRNAAYEKYKAILARIRNKEEALRTAAKTSYEKAIFNEQIHLRGTAQLEFELHQENSLAGSKLSKDQELQNNFGAALQQMYGRRLSLETELMENKLAKIKARFARRYEVWRQNIKLVKSQGRESWLQSKEKLQERRQVWLEDLRKNTKSFTANWNKQLEQSRRNKAQWAAKLIQNSKNTQFNKLKGQDAFGGTKLSNLKNQALAHGNKELIKKQQSLDMDDILASLGRKTMAEKLLSINSNISEYKLSSTPIDRRKILDISEFTDEFHKKQTASTKDMQTHILEKLVDYTKTLWGSFMDGIDERVARRNHAIAKNFADIFTSGNWRQQGERYSKNIIEESTGFGTKTSTKHVQAYVFYKWRNDAALNRYLVEEQDSDLMSILSTQTGKQDTNVLTAFNRELDTELLAKLGTKGMQAFLTQQQGALQLLNLGIFKSTSSDDYGFGAYIGKTVELDQDHINSKNSHEQNWSFYRAKYWTKADQNALFKEIAGDSIGSMDVGVVEGERLMIEFLRYKILQEHGLMNFNMSPMDRPLWAASEDDILTPPSLGFVQDLVSSAVMSIATLGLASLPAALVSASFSLAEAGLEGASALLGGYNPDTSLKRMARSMLTSALSAGINMGSSGFMNGAISGLAPFEKSILSGSLGGINSLVNNASSQLVNTGTIDFKSLAIGALTGGIGGGMAVGLNEFASLAGLSSGLLRTGADFAVELGGAALSALDLANARFDTREFGTKFLSKLAASLVSSGAQVGGALAVANLAKLRKDYGSSEQTSIFSPRLGTGLAEKSLADKLSRVLDWDAGMLSYIAESLVKGAITGSSQTLDGRALGKMLVSATANTGAAIDAYNNLDESLIRAIEFVQEIERRGTAKTGELLDQQFFLETAISSGRYKGALLQLLKDSKEQNLVFQEGGTELDKSGKSLGQAFTTENAVRILNKNLKGSLASQLLGLTARAHESRRNGRTDSAGEQAAEGIGAVLAHISMAAILDRQFGENFAGAWQDDLLRREISLYRKGDIYGLVQSALSNYDHSADNWKLMKDGTIVFDGKSDWYDEDAKLIYDAESTGYQSSLAEGLNYFIEEKPEDYRLPSNNKGKWDIQSVNQFMIDNSWTWSSELKTYTRNGKTVKGISEYGLKGVLEGYEFDESRLSYAARRLYHSSNNTAADSIKEQEDLSRPRSTRTALQTVKKLLGFGRLEKTLPHKDQESITKSFASWSSKELEEEMLLQSDDSTYAYMCVTFSVINSMMLSGFKPKAEFASKEKRAEESYESMHNSAMEYNFTAKGRKKLIETIFGISFVEKNFRNRDGANREPGLNAKAEFNSELGLKRYLDRKGLDNTNSIIVLRFRADRYWDNDSSGIHAVSLVMGQDDSSNTYFDPFSRFTMVGTSPGSVAGNRSLKFSDNISVDIYTISE